MDLLELKGIGVEYDSNGKKLLSLENVSFSVQSNQFVSIIGPSGSGKSTIIKILLGLLKPSKGSVTIGGKPLDPSKIKLSVVFQNAALFPWLDVLKNVEVALEPLTDDEDYIRETAKKFIKIVGIDGFEEAYPRELSGGMKQRVSIARALATGPDLLLLDEPFAALDVFTAQALREELLDLWESPSLPPDTILMVTHNVDEAVQMSDKIVVLSPRPGRVLGEVKIDLPRPRNTRSEDFYTVVDNVVKLMSSD
ncbi:MAG: ABC transporter ATP-binding protein [Candidatus Thermoplasmatota archaeon]|jgi:NitT/TauT family transport system ATP-binding protein|nr:ABC transporter ATP-binding protein [Candidatus Thermoplasmatota archaeon]MCL5790148.1 ABC transporter ATP-binding protein [Candidatus Thermoplasmatota archaeon]